MLRRRSKFPEAKPSNDVRKIIEKNYAMRRVNTQPDNSLEFFLKKSKQKER